MRAAIFISYVIFIINNRRIHTQTRSYVCSEINCSKRYNLTMTFQYEILIPSLSPPPSPSYTKKSHLTRHTRRSHIKNERPEYSVTASMNRAANSVTTATTSDDDDDEEEDYHRVLVKKEKEDHDQILIKQEKEDYERVLVKQEDALSNHIPATVYPSNTINQQPNYWPTNPPCYSNNNNIIYSSLPTVYQPTENGYYYHGYQSYYSF